ncbi:MAG: hypothetical protein Kow00121_21340 [Elainellaceae cyanobacterium]
MQPDRNSNQLKIKKGNNKAIAFLTGTSLSLVATIVSLTGTSVRAQEAEPLEQQPQEMESLEQQQIQETEPLTPEVQETEPIEPDIQENEPFNPQTQETEQLEQPTQEAEQLTDDEQNVTREEVINRAEDFVGQTITIRGGVVEEQPAAGLFRIANQGLFGTEEILVIGATGIPEVPEQDVDIQVTGEVRRFVVNDVVSEFGFNSSDEFYEAYGDEYADYEGQPAIFAQSIALSPTPNEVGSDPEAFYGRVVAIEGVIGNIASENIFTIQGEGLFGSNLLVVNPNSLPVPQEGEDVVLTGTIRQFSEAQQEYEYLQNAETQAGVEYQEGPVLYVDGIYPSAQ